MLPKRQIPVIGSTWQVPPEWATEMASDCRWRFRQQIGKVRAEGAELPVCGARMPFPVRRPISATFSAKGYAHLWVLHDAILDCRRSLVGAFRCFYSSLVEVHFVPAIAGC